ncbi:MAG: glucose-1-phosphate adenylyltransferase [Deltaproteobacteria bacterium]|nr:glucose-1-phosphate adenylyltransferase [Deltaproteobacteria bacterium]
MNDTLAMVLAGGRVDAVGVLTARRSMAAVPFGGMYRIIDFVLTNLSASRIGQVGILSQFRPASLMDHVGIGRPWDFNGRTRELTFLPPYQGTRDVDWYRGTADAVMQNLHVIERTRPRDVLVVAGDHAYRMDYRPLIEFHRRAKSDLTMVFKRMDCGRPSRFGVGVLGEGRRVVSYHEKPGDPPSDLASLTIYVFRTEALVARLKENAATGRTFHFYDEVIPRMVAEDRVFGFPFRGAWEYLRPLSGYHDAHMRLVSPRGGVPLFGLLTDLDSQGVGDAPSAEFSGGGSARRSMVAPGCRIAGKVRNSVLFPWVRVEPGAVVEDSVILHDTVIRKGARVVRAVVDKEVVVGEGAVVGGGEAVAAVGKLAHLGNGARVAEGAAVGAGTEVPEGGVVAAAGVGDPR